MDAATFCNGIDFGSTGILSKDRDKITITELTPTTFSLTGVNSSTFGSVVPNSGHCNVFAVPQYNSLGNSVTTVFDQASPIVGSGVSVNTTTGDITLATGLTYALTGTAFVNVAGATCQWFSLTANTFLGQPAPVGTPCTLVVTTAGTLDVCLKVIAPTGTSFQYPAQITNASATVEVVSGFIA